MAKSIEIVVRADADQDDCLSAAAASYVEEHPELGGYDLAPRWQDEDDRTMVVLTVPAWAPCCSECGAELEVTLVDP